MTMATILGKKAGKPAELSSESESVRLDDVEPELEPESPTEQPLRSDPAPDLTHSPLLVLSPPSPSALPPLTYSPTTSCRAPVHYAPAAQEITADYRPWASPLRWSQQATWAHDQEAHSCRP
eukprot:NODE_3678_length_745_cov_17.306034_g3088_i0.p1 GENE.NODE_3678_length_745_cov_17.306034_g3088_i0~~NODE_3678_length_745_cov_17.306034_g3088_i0.p1  ORF type:complete len:122 (+),score=9.57 NODE_3678_length_745_cov_17.306034_g3088_i0:137-502(+)